MVAATQANSFVLVSKLQEITQKAKASNQALKSKLQAVLEEQVGQVEQLQHLKDEKAALEEQLSALKLDQSDSVWSLESKLMKAESDAEAMQAQEKELRSELEQAFFSYCFV